MHKLLLRPSLLLPLIAVSSSLPLTARSESSQSTRCKPTIARMVTEGDRNFRRGTLLCPQDFVSPVPGKRPRLFCHATEAVLVGRTGRVAELCATDANSAALRGGEEGSLNVNTRGNEDELKLLAPFGPTIIQQRPDLTWELVEEATHYVISIEGYHFNLKQTVSETRFQYPSSWPALEYGSAYELEILAYQGKQPISVGRTTINLVLEKDAVAIQEQAAAMKKLPVPLSEVAVELDTLYMTHNLFHESIQFLENLREKGQSNLKLNQLLAKRYSQVGHPELAEAILEEAQLPTRIKLPQKKGWE